MIESPSTEAYVLDQEQTESEKPLLIDEAKDLDVLLVSTPPITAKLRTAIRHLRTIAGPLARFRGLHIALLYHFLYSLTLSIFRLVFIQPIAAILCSVLLCRIHMVWTHAVITMPSSKHWWQRLSSFKSTAAKQLLLPTALWALAQQLCIYIPGLLLVTSHDTFRNPGVYGVNPETMQKIALAQMGFAVLMFFATIILIVVPAEVSLKRVEASLLAEDEVTIVPFDKSFAGKFKPINLGGTGAVSMLDAWKTFDKQARIRLIKLYVKIFALQIAVAVIFTMVMIGELKMITGTEFQRLVHVARKSFKGEL